MAKVKVKMNSRGAQQLLKSPEVQADMLRRAQAVADGAGEGFSADVIVGRTRARAQAKADTFEAKLKNTREQTLLKNIDRGR
ncbi:hypothetical protein [Glutamicibacter sp. X7]